MVVWAVQHFIFQTWWPTAVGLERRNGSLNVSVAVASGPLQDAMARLTVVTLPMNINAVSAPHRPMHVMLDWPLAIFSCPFVPHLVSFHMASSYYCWVSGKKGKRFPIIMTFSGSLLLFMLPISLDEIECLPFEWECDTGDCIPRVLLCDGSPDCLSDSSDEKYCTSESSTCIHIGHLYTYAP